MCVLYQFDWQGHLSNPRKSLSRLCGFELNNWTIDFLPVGDAFRITINTKRIKNATLIKRQFIIMNRS